MLKKTIIASLAAMTMMSASYAAPSFGSSSWSLSEDGSSAAKKAKAASDSSLVGFFLTAIGFNETLSPEIFLANATKSEPGDDKKSVRDVKKPCTSTQQQALGQTPRPEEETGAAGDHDFLHGPEPILFAF